MRLPEVVETMGATTVGTVKTLQGQRSWPAWAEVACALAMGKEYLQARAQFLCHTCVWERQGQQFGRLQQPP